jgi:tetratricopeptide (TPR) repeat protein
VGKTTLAQYAARRLTHHYPDGQIIVELNGQGNNALTSPLKAMQEVIRVFQPTLPPLDDAAQARAIYRDTLSGKRALILLDNAASTDQIRDLIPPPQCCALITSRQLVKPPGCTALWLDLLPLDESVALLHRLAPNALGTEAEWNRLADLCGCLPLALRVAGSTLDSSDDLTLPGYLTELADESKRPHRLTIDGDTSANVAAVLRHSLNRLIDQDPTLAARWQMISVFPADFDRTAAAAVWSEAEIEVALILRRLRDRSLLLYDQTRDRYRLHDLMRPLAHCLFETHPVQDPAPTTANRFTVAQSRFILHFMEVLKDADALYLRDQNGVALGLAQYDTESHNIVAAAALAIDRSEHDSTAQWVSAWLPNSGANILNLRLSQNEWIVWLTTAATAAHRMGELHLCAIHLGNLGNAYAGLGEMRRAIDFYQNALNISREIGDRHGEGNRLGNLGSAYADLGETEQAINYHQQALIIAQEIGDRRGEGHRLGNLGSAYTDLGKAQRASDFYQRSLAIAQEIGDRRSEGIQLGNLGLAYAELGKTQRAIDFYQQALAIAREIGDRRGEVIHLNNLGNAHTALGETQLAINVYQQSHAIAKEIGDKRGEGICLGSLGASHTELGDIPTAIALVKQALAIFVAIESPYADKARQQLAQLRGDAPQG